MIQAAFNLKGRGHRAGVDGHKLTSFSITTATQMSPLVVSISGVTSAT